MWGIEIVEGQDAQPNHPKQFDNLSGKTIGLLVRMTEPIWYKGDVLVLDSGFCVLQALIEIRKRGVFAASVIKNDDFGQNLFLVMLSMTTLLKGIFLRLIVGVVISHPGMQLSLST